MSTPPTQPTDPNEPPPFDIEAARARYRRMMRSWPMRIIYLLLIVTIVFAWAWAGAAVFASSVENLPGHDITVPVADCVSCHTEGAEANNAPPMNHPTFPTCGFCHRQGPPPQTSQIPIDHGWLVQ